MATTETRTSQRGAAEQNPPVLEPLTEEELEWALDFARRAVNQVGAGIPLSKKAMSKAFTKTEERMRRNFKARD